MKKNLLRALSAAFLMLLTSFAVSAQSPVTWKTSKAMINNNEGYIFITATIQNGWHIYGLEATDDGPVPTTITFTETPGVRFTGPITPLRMPKVEMDDMFGVQVKSWEGEVTFARKFKLASGTQSATVPVTVSYMCCNDASCRPPVTENLTVKVK